MRRVPLLSTLALSLVTSLAAVGQPAEPARVSETAEAAMLKDARAIGAACQRYMVEMASEKVSFNVDPATGKITGLVATYLGQITPGTKAVDNELSNPDDSFSLQNPNAFGGAVVTFDADGKRTK